MGNNIKDRWQELDGFFKGFVVGMLMVIVAAMVVFYMFGGHDKDIKSSKS